MSNASGSWSVEDQKRILIVEDHAKLAELLGDGLRSEGFLVAVASTGDEGLARLEHETFDVAVLDMMLPGRDGLEILSALRQRDGRTGVIVLTARDTLADRLRGLDAGADDYLVKPFAFPELLARIRALLRRQSGPEAQRLAILDLQINLVTRQVMRGNRVVDLSPKEFEVLAYLMVRAGQTVTREMLARDVWRQPERGTPLNNVIDVHIGRLRRKIDHEGEPGLVRTLRGLGFVVGPLTRS